MLYRTVQLSRLKILKKPLHFLDRRIGHLERVDRNHAARRATRVRSGQAAVSSRSHHPLELRGLGCHRRPGTQTVARTLRAYRSAAAQNKERGAHRAFHRSLPGTRPFHPPDRSESQLAASTTLGPGQLLPNSHLKHLNPKTSAHTRTHTALRPLLPAPLAGWIGPLLRRFVDFLAAPVCSTWSRFASERNLSRIHGSGFARTEATCSTR